MSYKDLINKLESEMKGYHLSLHTFPSGGIIEFSGCEECETEGHYSASWKNHNGGSIDSALAEIKDDYRKNIKSQNSKDEK